MLSQSRYSLLKAALFWVVVVALLATVFACGEPTAPVPVATVVVTPANQTLHSLGETLQLTVVARDADGNVLEGRTVTWASSAAGIVSVDAGTAAAVQNGEATITATIDGVAAGTKVIVDQVVTAVEITPAQITLKSLGEVSNFTGKPKDARGNVVEGKVLAWQSSAPGVVAANTSGGVMAVANGAATLAASVDGIAGTSSVTVAQAPAKLAFITQPLPTQNGVTMAKVEVQVRDALGTLVPDATNAVTLSLGTNPAGGTLSGTTQVAAANGVASFTALAIEKPGVGYALAASGAGMSAAVSNAFEIMSVPVRLDSVTLAGATIKIGGSLSYSAWILNGEGKNASGMLLQGYILQGNFNNAAGGAQVFTCGPSSGVVKPGPCKADWALNATVGTFVAGPATAKIELYEGQVLRGTITLPITIVP